MGGYNGIGGYTKAGVITTAGVATAAGKIVYFFERKIVYFQEW
jgi:hypothetical protein